MNNNEDTWWLVCEAVAVVVRNHAWPGFNPSVKHVEYLMRNFTPVVASRRTTRQTFLRLWSQIVKLLPMHHIYDKMCLTGHSGQYSRHDHEHKFTIIFNCKRRIQKSIFDDRTINLDYKKH